MTHSVKNNDIVTTIPTAMNSEEFKIYNGKCNTFNCYGDCKLRSGFMKMKSKLQ